MGWQSVLALLHIKEEQGQQPTHMPPLSLASSTDTQQKCSPVGLRAAFSADVSRTCSSTSNFLACWVSLGCGCSSDGHLGISGLLDHHPVGCCPSSSLLQAPGKKAAFLLLSASTCMQKVLGVQPCAVCSLLLHCCSCGQQQRPFYAK